MKLLLVASVLVGVAYGAPQGYGYNAPSAGPGYGAAAVGHPGCSNGKILNVDGSCVFPKVTRQVYVYTAPSQPPVYGPPPPVPQPEVLSNIIFIRTPEPHQPPEPIVVGPPRVNNVVYVLHKKQQHQQKVIEVPAPAPKEPQVYFVHYGDGENPELPGGIDLQTALNSAASAGGQIIGGGGFGGGLGGSIGGGLGVGGIVGGGDIRFGGDISLEDGYQAPKPSGLYSAP